MEHDIGWLSKNYGSHIPFNQLIPFPIDLSHLSSTMHKSPMLRPYLRYSQILSAWLCPSNQPLGIFPKLSEDLWAHKNVENHHHVANFTLGSTKTLPQLIHGGYGNAILSILRHSAILKPPISDTLPKIALNHCQLSRAYISISIPIHMLHHTPSYSIYSPKKWLFILYQSNLRVSLGDPQ